jgi:hypothetical protein
MQISHVVGTGVPRAELIFSGAAASPTAVRNGADADPRWSYAPAPLQLPCGVSHLPKDSKFEGENNNNMFRLGSVFCRSKKTS